ncbi:MAG TPA: lamin tail domain-containing protein, partial [Longimicrobiaceae bacterium]|nr:lamin tail domain-containing protein [Longimicrobiaceae bacterium]
MRRTLLRATGPLALVFALFACSEAPLGPSLPAEGAQLSTAVAVPQVVISQVYGGGGNSGATLRNDFIELFNPGTAPVSLAGWSVQYASSTGTTWQATALSGTIQPGGYYLVQQAAGTGGTVSLPTPDATGSIPMSGTAGKVALAQTTAALSGACPAGVVDLVSFGTASTNCGAGTTPTLSNTTAALRNAQGCAYTGSLTADFGTGTPSPRNGGSPTYTCPVVDPRQPASVSIAPVSDTVTVGSTQAFTARAFDANGQEIAGTAFTWASSDPAVATVSGSGVASAVAAGSATITATTANGVSGSAALLVQGGGGGSATNVRVSEFHYDNDGTDTGEAVEIEGDANGSLAGWKLVLYSGSTGSATQGQSYGT